MRAILHGEAIPPGRWPADDPPLTLERAQLIVTALQDCTPHSDQHEFDEGVRSLLYGVWLRLGPVADAEVFPALEGSWAGSVLDAMTRHYAERLEARRRHEERQGVRQRDWKK